MVNKLILQGRLTRDVELRSTQSGTAVAAFTVAWSEKYKDTEQKLFMPCVAWRHTAEFASRYFSKGQETLVEGFLTTRKWQDKNGNNRETIELIVDKMHFCGAKKEESAPAYGAPAGYGAPAAGYGAPAAYGGYQPAGAPVRVEFTEIEDDDGDLPF